ncbi:type-F conjugative transfer system secretin TraK, partial [Methylomonas sp. SURF-1]|nr:type-F conjugative transfer system secretin TraK [Methylomonas sp. SURF-1]
MQIRKCALMIGLFGAACCVVAEPQSVDLLAVPADVLKTGQSQETAPTGTGGIAPQTIKVSAGINEIITVAQNHLNRIVTPFPSPRVRTVSRAETQVEGNVVYVASNSEDPVTLYITPGENESLAISLTLAPKLIPPREIRLELAGVEYSRLTQTQPAAKKSGNVDDTVQQEHVAQLKATLRELALMQSPNGFSGRPVSA